MTRISVLYVTARPGGFDILKHDLLRQSFEDFEVVVVDDLASQRRDEVTDYLSAFDLTYVEPREPRESDVWNLNKAYNDGIAASEGELIVSLQDYIWIPEDGLERFWEVYRDTGDFVTGIGHKYGEPSEAADLDGKISIFDGEFADQPRDVVEEDIRMGDLQGIQRTRFDGWELNWAAFPRAAAYTLGGFDESMDRMYSGDNVQFAYRASQLGYRFVLDAANECRGLAHSRWFPYPDDWEEKHFNNRPRLAKYNRRFVFDYL